MLTNAKISLLRYSADTDEYVNIGTFNAWAFEKKAISNSVNGDENTDVIHIRINLSDIDSIKVGDFVCIGEKVSTTDMAECRKVIRVTRNYYGSNKHWHIEV